MKLNNPFNIRQVKSNKWLGARWTYKGDFVRFNSTLYSCRAFLVILSTYRYRYGITTIYDILHRYAPTTENDTEAYINYVCKRLKSTPDTEIDKNNLYDFASAVAFMESNYILTKEEYNKALSLTNY